MRKIIAQRAKEREEHLKKMSKNKESAGNFNVPKTQEDRSSFDK